jgi:MBG domain (YGX type)/Putative Ig domain/Bacterial Ig domain/MBG domain
MISLFQCQKKSRAGRAILHFVFALSALSPVMARAQIAITTSALPVGNTSNTYTATLAATGGTAPYTWQLTGGSLPSGLSLSASGAITGKVTTVTPGTPPVPASFTIQVIDSTLNTATQTYAITVLSPGSHSLVINQLFSGGNGSTSSPYAYNYVEIFNASPSVIDLQNWTVQIAPATSAFSQTGVYPLGSLDPYTAGITGGSDGKGSYPAFQITYSAAFTASNCNPAATSPQVNSAFPAFHCWLNPGQFMLVLLGTTSSTGALTNLPQITPDLDLTDGYINGTANSADTGAVLGNVGAVAATSSAPTIWVGHNVTTSNVNTYIPKVNPSDGMIALANGVGVGAVCPAATIANPNPSAIFSPLTSDFVGYIAQLSAGGEAPPICWEGATAAGYATHVSSSGKNTNALIRSAGNGKINAAVTGVAAPAGTILPTTGVTLTPCGDTDNNLTDFPPIANGLKGQINWVLHNSQQILTKATTTTLNSPTSYTPVACASLNPVGPTVTAAFSQPIVAQGAGGGSVTETLTVTVTPSNNPTSALFNVNVNLSGVAGAGTTAPLIASSVGVPDGHGNLNFQEQITIPTTTVGTLSFPITVLDDAYRGGVNANTATPLNAVVMVGSACQTPVSTAQTVQLGWNSPHSIALTGQVGQNCNSGDTLTYAIQSQPLNGALSLASGNSITYTPNSGFNGLDSFTFNVTDATNSAGPLTGAVATVNLVVSATGVTPVLKLSCPAASYDASFHGCTTTLTPFVAGTTSVSYNGSATAPTAAGSYPVSASFVSSGSPSQNTSATGVLVISQATPTLTVLCPTVSFTGSPLGCTASVPALGAITPSGTISITYNGSSAPPTNGGTYVVAASFTSSDPNYASTTATSSLTIYEPLVTITANSQTITYGVALPAFTYIVSPSIPLQTNPVCTSSATGASNVGTYAGAITCSGAAKVGTLFTYAAASMTVVPAAATVTANNQTMAAGAAVPALTYATTPGGVTFTTAPKCTTTATASSSAGTYPISCAGAVASNYNLSYAGGTMTVSVAPTIPNSVPTIAGLSSMTASAGSANFALTVTGGGFVPGATVLWNGSARTTTFVSATQLTAAILATDLTAVGTADVAVFNPAPGGGTSTSLTFSIDSAAQTQGAFTVTSSSSTLTATHGQSATTALTFSNLPQGAVVSAVCYNLPALGYCNYSPGTLTISTGAATPPGTYHVLVVCSTSGLQSSSNRPASSTILCGLIGFPIGLLMLYRGRRFRLYGLGLLSVLFLTVVIGCGGNSSNPSSPVVAAQVSTALTLTVQ